METFSLRNVETVEEASRSQVDQVFVRSQTVVSRRVAGETLIVPIRGKVGDLASIYSFNGTGSLIWETLATPANLAALVSAVESDYEVEHDQAKIDVTQFVNDMLSVGLVETRPAVAMAAIQSSASNESSAMR